MSWISFLIAFVERFSVDALFPVQRPQFRMPRDPCDDGNCRAE